MDIKRVISTMKAFAHDFVDVYQEAAAESSDPVDIASLLDPRFLTEVRDTLRDIQGMPEHVANQRAPIAAACIVLEWAERQGKEGVLVQDDFDFDADCSCEESEEHVDG